MHEALRPDDAVAVVACEVGLDEGVGLVLELALGVVEVDLDDLEPRHRRADTARQSLGSLPRESARGLAGDRRQDRLESVGRAIGEDGGAHAARAVMARGPLDPER